MVETALLAVHVLAATCWFGPRLFWARRLRTALAHSDSAKVTVPAIGRELTFSGIAALLVIATGLALIFQMGGFKVVPHRIHAGLALTLIAFVGGLILEVPAMTKIRVIAERGTSTEALPLVKHVVMGVMLEHTLWLVTLVLMVWRIPPT